jgi:hypothetical protein
MVGGRFGVMDITISFEASASNPSAKSNRTPEKQRNTEIFHRTKLMLFEQPIDKTRFLLVEFI